MPLAGLLITQNNEVSAPPRCDQDLPATDESRRSSDAAPVPGYGELAELFFAGPIKSGSNKNRSGRPKNELHYLLEGKSSGDAPLFEISVGSRRQVGTRAAGRLTHTRERE
jgi:hypothetical protein